MRVNRVLVIPIVLLLIISIYAILHESFFLVKVENGFYEDLQMFYRGGKILLIDPSDIYSVVGYFYSPSFSIFSLLLFYFFPLWEAHFVLWGLNIILGIGLIIELNKIFKLMELNNDLYRVIFLSIAILSWDVYGQFYFPQAKMIVAFIIFFVIRREMEFREEKSLKYYIINYSLMSFSLGISPYFIFLYMIIFINDVGRENLLRRSSIEKLFLFAIIILAENFLFILYPNLIFDFFDKGLGFSNGEGWNWDIYVFYLRDLELPLGNFRIYFITSYIALSILIGISSYQLKTKVGLFGVVYLLTSSYGTVDEFIPICMVLFLFISFLEQEDRILDGIKKNKLVVIGLIGIILINANPYDPYTLYKYFPILLSPPFVSIMKFRVLIFVSMMVIPLIILKIKMIDFRNF